MEENIQWGDGNIFENDDDDAGTNIVVWLLSTVWCHWKEPNVGWRWPKA